MGRFVWVGAGMGWCWNGLAGMGWLEWVGWNGLAGMGWCWNGLVLEWAGAGMQPKSQLDFVFTYIVTLLLCSQLFSLRVKYVRIYMSLHIQSTVSK